jgi:hypothetical protein
MSSQIPSQWTWSTVNLLEEEIRLWDEYKAEYALTVSLWESLFQRMFLIGL